MWRLMVGTVDCSSRSQRTAPLARSMAYTIQRWPATASRLPWSSPGSYSPLTGCGSSPALTAVVTNTCSPETIGELQPRPGMSMVQTTFSVSLQRSGRSGWSGATPASRPRNRGQSLLARATGSASSSTTVVSSPWQKPRCIRPAMHPAWTALLVGCICPIYALLAPCQPGACPVSVRRGVSPRAASNVLFIACLAFRAVVSLSVKAHYKDSAAHRFSL